MKENEQMLKDLKECLEEGIQWQDNSCGQFIRHFSQFRTLREEINVVIAAQAGKQGGG